MAGPRSKSTAGRVQNDFVVCVHGAEAPTHEEWDELLALFRTVPDIGRVRVLVLTMGGAPNAVQRAKLNKVLANAKPPIALLTSSVVARTVGVAISWFHPRLRMFDPKELERAFDHLDASQADRQMMTRLLEELRRELRV